MESLGTVTARNGSFSMEKFNKSNMQYQYKKLFLSVFSMAAFTAYLLKENKHPWQKTIRDVLNIYIFTSEPIADTHHLCPDNHASMLAGRCTT